VWLAFYLIAKNLVREKKLSELRNAFISNMSHELKTPVSTIGVALEAISNFEAGDDPELRKEYLEISRLELDRLGLLVDKTLNISLFEQGKFVCNIQKLDIKKEIDTILQTLRISLDNLNVELKYTFNGQNFDILADQSHMSNVIHNLIENAIKYSESEANISIHIEELKDNIRISISDQGIGIPEEYQKHVFDKFFRVPTGDVHNIKGHGLGLSYVKEAVEKQNGSIHLVSELNKGSNFIILMPKAPGNV
jgi:signal transduction histidine kinase